MASKNPLSLSISRKLLRIGIVLNWITGALILALLIATVVAEEPVMRALGILHGPGARWAVAAGQAIMLIGILAVPVTNVVLTRLLAVVETVDVDPFRVENAERLQMIALAVLVLNLMHVTITFLSGPAGIKGGGDLNFSPTRWLSVFLLFVLARVFEQGARMRDDLEGTI